MLAIDFLKLPRTTRGNRYVLVCSDYFTRWPEAFATTDQTSETVAKVLFDGVIARHGVPLTIHSDQGSSFESRVIQRLCQLMGVQKTRTTPYHPQGDGLVERLNRSLIGILRRHCADRPLEWDLWLPAALQAYRVTKQTSTGVSPFELLYGRKPRLPTDIACGSAPPVPTDTTEYLNQLHQQMNSAREIVDANRAAAQERQRHDAPVHVHQYQHGDWFIYMIPDDGEGRHTNYCLSGTVLSKSFKNQATMTSTKLSTRQRVDDVVGYIMIACNRATVVPTSQQKRMGSQYIFRPSRAHRRNRKRALPIRRLPRTRMLKKNAPFC